MVMYTEPDRRLNCRKHEEIICPVSFECEGRVVEATLVDISRKGARFKRCAARDGLMMAGQAEIEYTIKTRFGAARCRAQTRWTRSSNEDMVWGVEFTAVPISADDPLSRVMEAIPRIGTHCYDYMM